jgi:hypothetical protein
VGCFEWAACGAWSDAVPSPEKSRDQEQPVTESQSTGLDNNEATGWGERIRRWWFKLWTGWMALGLTILAFAIAIPAEFIVAEVVELSNSLSFWQHLAAFGIVWIIEAMYVTGSVVLSLAAPTLGALVGGVGLAFPAGRTRLNMGSVACCLLLLTALFFRHRLYRAFL